MVISLDLIKILRGKTGVSIQACKKALEEAKGNEDDALEILRKRGEAKVIERGIRETGQGIVMSYVHNNNKVGVLLQLGCETDFVARSPDFQSLGKDFALHIVAMNPLYISPEDVPKELIEKEREIWKSQIANEGKPSSMFEKILAGKEKKFREEVSFLKQPFVKNPDIAIEKLLADVVLKFGENIKVIRFVRFSF